MFGDIVHEYLLYRYTEIADWWNARPHISLWEFGGNNALEQSDTQVSVLDEVYITPEF